MLLLAETSPLSNEFQLNLISLLGILALILSILAYFRRKPSLDTELIQLRTTIESLTATVAKLVTNQEEHATHAQQIADLKHEVVQLKAHREEDQRSQRTYIRETTKEIFTAIDALKSTFSTNVQAMERALGKLEGSMEGIGDRVSRLEEQS
jgi:predicted  nucleic acid-binding Zn-ribbon protein